MPKDSAIGWTRLFPLTDAHARYEFGCRPEVDVNPRF